MDIWFLTERDWSTVYYFISFVMSMSGAKFEEHSFYDSRDFLYSVFYYLSCKPHDIITFLIHQIQNIISLKLKKRYSKKENTIIFLKSLSNKQKSLPLVSQNVCFSTSEQTCDLFLKTAKNPLL